MQANGLSFTIFAYKRPRVLRNPTTTHCIVNSRVDRLLQWKQNITNESVNDALPHAATTSLLFYLILTVITGPSQNRACAIYAHGSSHGLLTLIRGFGRGNRTIISLNFSQLRQFFFPLRFNHLNCSFSTSMPNRTIPRRLSVTPQ